MHCRRHRHHVRGGGRGLFSHPHFPLRSLTTAALERFAGFRLVADAPGSKIAVRASSARIRAVASRPRRRAVACASMVVAARLRSSSPSGTDAAALVSSTGTSALVDIRRRRSCTYVNAGRSDLFAVAGRVSSQNREGREAGRMLDVRGHQLIPLPFELFQGAGFVRGDLRCRLGTKRGGSGALVHFRSLKVIARNPNPLKIGVYGIRDMTSGIAAVAGRPVLFRFNTSAIKQRGTAPRPGGQEELTAASATGKTFKPAARLSDPCC